MRNTHQLGKTAGLICAALSALMALAGCGTRESANPSGPRTHAPQATSANAAAATPAVVGNAAPTAAVGPGGPEATGPAVTETLDAAGITVERLAGGAIRVRGEDRWGVRVDTTYADATYFGNAAPVIGRSLTEAQARALLALVPRVQAQAGDAR